jgi:4-hydroxybenzoyl-CoA reductase subunit beta
VHLDPFELHLPRTLEEVMELARRYEGQFDYLAGGTDLLPNYKMHLNPRAHLIALDRVEGLDRIDPGEGRLGAMVRLARLEEAPVGLDGSFPGLLTAVREVATPLVRASATVGGNLLLETRCFFFNQSRFWRESLGYCLKAEGSVCHVVPQRERCYATFSGDLAPILLVLGARVELVHPQGAREIPLNELYDPTGDGIRRTRLRPGELLVAVRVPPEGRTLRATYRKLRVRPAFDFPELGVAVALESEGERVRRLHVAIGGVETYPRLMDRETAPVWGETLTPDRLRSLCESVSRAVRPVHNTYFPPDYRKKMVGVFLRRAVEALGRAG